MSDDLEEMKADIKAIREKLAPEPRSTYIERPAPPRSAMYHGVFFIVLATISTASFVYGKQHEGNSSAIVFLALWLFCGIPALFQLLMMLGTLARTKSWTTKID